MTGKTLDALQRKAIEDETKLVMDLATYICDPVGIEQIEQARSILTRIRSIGADEVIRRLYQVPSPDVAPASDPMDTPDSTSHQEFCDLWREMTPTQRRAAIDFIRSEGLLVEAPEGCRLVIGFEG